MAALEVTLYGTREISLTALGKHASTGKKRNFVGTP
jgi:hypothetical protein